MAREFVYTNVKDILRDYQNTPTEKYVNWSEPVTVKIHGNTLSIRWGLPNKYMWVIYRNKPYWFMKRGITVRQLESGWVMYWTQIL